MEKEYFICKRKLNLEEIKDFFRNLGDSGVIYDKAFGYRSKSQNGRFVTGKSLDEVT